MPATPRIVRPISERLLLELHELTIKQATAGLQKRLFSCEEYVAHLLRRAGQQARLNAFVSFDASAMLALAREADRADAEAALRPLHGMPIAIKDNINTVMLPTTAGTAGLSSRFPKTNASVVQALFSAGAIPGGKTNMHELALGVTSNNCWSGAVRNPWNIDMIAGGSSGGSAAAVAGRVSPAALGTDTGASVRLPASLCGVVGFRPSVRRYPGDGIVPVSRSRDVVGPIARSVEDVALIDEILSGHRQALEVLEPRAIRLGVPRAPFFQDLDSNVQTVIEAALSALAGAGVQLVEISLGSVNLWTEKIGLAAVLHEMARDMPHYLNECGYDLSLEEIVAGISSPDVAHLFAQRRELDISGNAYHAALDARVHLQAAYAECFSAHRLDAIVFPTAPMPASRVGEDHSVLLNGRRVPTFPTYIRNTDPGSNAGIPGISLPAGLASTGLPIGLELDGPSCGDRRLLAIAAMVERALPPAPSPPDLDQLQGGRDAPELNQHSLRAAATL